MATADLPHPVAPRARRRMPSPRPVILGIAGILGFLLVWQLLPTIGVVNPAYFPTATATLGELGELVRDVEFWRNVGRTLTAWGIGLLIATVLACVLGAVVGLVPFLRRATHTTVEFLRPIPSVALIPLAVLMFGTRMGSTLLLVVYAAFWQVLVQVLYGVVDVDPLQRDMARSYRFGRRAVLGKIVFPVVLPYALTGFRLAASVALVLTITGELIIGTPGLGQLIAQARTAGATEVMYALVLVAGLLGVAVNLGMRAVERKLLPWHPSVRVAAA